MDFSRIRLFHGKKLKSSFVFIKWIDYTFPVKDNHKSLREDMGKGNWKGLKTIIRYRCYREETGKEKARWTERYYSGSGDTSAGELYRNIRGHWPIENRLHWSLDVVFGEDAARVSRGHGPEKKKRITAAMNPEYMLTVIFGR